MKTVVLTGPVGGGKSLLARMLEIRGAAIIDADRLGHEVLEEPRVSAELSDAFGPDVLNDGWIDRRRLGDLVFRDAEAMAVLNRVTHPVLAARIDDQLAELAAEGAHPLAVLEAAVYFLLPVTFTADLVVTVTAAPEIRVRRLQERNGLDRDAALARIRSQRDLARRWEQADLVVFNDDGPRVLEDAADDIIARLGLAGPPSATPNP